MEYTVMDKWIEEIKEIMAKARQRIASDVNSVMLDTYWQENRNSINGIEKSDIRC